MESADRSGKDSCGDRLGSRVSPVFINWTIGQPFFFFFFVAINYTHIFYFRFMSRFLFRFTLLLISILKSLLGFSEELEIYFLRLKRLAYFI